MNRGSVFAHFVKNFVAYPGRQSLSLRHRFWQSKTFSEACIFVQFSKFKYCFDHSAKSHYWGRFQKMNTNSALKTESYSFWFYFPKTQSLFYCWPPALLALIYCRDAVQKLHHWFCDFHLMTPPSGFNIYSGAWWRHQMKTFAALLALCAGNSPVTGEFPAQRPVTRSFHVFFDLRLNKRLSKQSWGWWFETPSRSLWRHCNVKIVLPPVNIIYSWSLFYACI